MIRRLRTREGSRPRDPWRVQTIERLLVTPMQTVSRRARTRALPGCLANLKLKTYNL